MPASPQEVQYASGARRSEIPDTGKDHICERIHIGASYRLSGGPGRRPRGPQWSPQQLNKLAIVSPALAAHINRLKADPEGKSVWNIQSRPEDGISFPTVNEVLDTLALDDQLVVKGVASALSEYCNVLWFYQIIPTSFPSCLQWVAIDDDTTRNIIGAFSIPPPDNSPFSLHTFGLARYCWSDSNTPYSYKTDLHLANCAFILNWQGVFKRAIRHVIWETKPTDVVLLHTPVKYLKVTGPDGINKLRHREKAQVFSHLLRYLFRHRTTDVATVDNITSLLSYNGIEVGAIPSEFDDLSVNELMRRIEAILLPSPPESPAVPEPGRMKHSRQATHGSSKTASSSGSDRNSGPPRQATNTSQMTNGSRGTHGGDGRGRRAAGGGGASSSSSHHVTYLNRPNPSWKPLVVPIWVGISSGINSLRFIRKSSSEAPGPEPEPPREDRGGLALHIAFVREMLDDLNTFILRQHDEVAREMLDRRDLEIAGWAENLRNM
ncbi:hypothetical protein QBC37DRAFT_323623 [Rhypophila decipiens]|uniref:Uncharacterized protein n=1 Tax=Rhypophila decipiens TaxID=261697 RepID=A0AAN7B471_9PEZI|nr:hypothetical protein QBC37DRAFT_323623 [Rhypophila decipiens]